MKIALLTHRYPLPEKPKLKSDVDALHHITKWWARDGHEVHVVVLYQHQNLHDGVPKPFFYTARLSDLERDGVHVHLVETRFIHALPRLSDAYFNILGKKAAGKIGPCDMTLVHFPSRMFSFAQAFHPGKDKVGVLHATDLQRYSAGNQEARSLLETLQKQYAAVGFRSDALRRQYHALNVEKKPEFLAMSGAPFVDMPPSPRREGPMRVLYVGKLIPRKRPDKLVEIISRLDSPWRLTVVGDGPLKETVAEKIRALGLSDRAEMTGPVSREKVLEYMRQSDVFVLQSYDETFGIVYLEAMAQRCICVGSRGEGIDGAIVDGENGLLVDARSDEELLSALRRIAAMPDQERERIREAAYETARAMTEEGMARRYLTLAQNALEASDI